MADKQELTDKCKAFALRIVKLHKYLQSEKKEFALSEKLLQTGTNVGVNIYMAFLMKGGEEYYEGLITALTDTCKTAFWLELLRDAGYIEAKQYQSINDDCTEILRMLKYVTQSE